MAHIGSASFLDISFTPAGTAVLAEPINSKAGSNSTGAILRNMVVRGVEVTVQQLFGVTSMAGQSCYDSGRRAEELRTAGCRQVGCGVLVADYKNMTDVLLTMEIFERYCKVPIDSCDCNQVDRKQGWYMWKLLESALLVHFYCRLGKEDSVHLE
jgi:hypothetical protein